ncbi:LysR substrate-binding domain-containing protein [Kluyvera ascorbata]|uniref:LysR family transcriptional regulator n=1 Tax=Kluyvera ascorbata TaxID=51288 RepID=UPI002ABBCA9D|nr:LysR family transcriptional regulator [Kluyvera ascorbata]MDZ4033169.1 LysR substrate-binding domain-containing protein [Kluyvera ascorbata]
MSLPPLYALRAFEAAARLGSFSKAAELLNVTPGAVSRHVRTLEQWFDCALFQRHGPRVTVTDAGQTLAAQLGEGFQSLERACEAFGHRRRELRLKAPSTLTMRWLLAALQPLTSPQIALSSVWMDTDTVDFSREPYDCAILLGDGQFGSGTQSQLLFEEWLIPICAPQLTAQARGNLERCELIHPSPDRRDWRRWLKRTGQFSTLNTARGTVFDTLEQGYLAAIGGHGVAIGDLLLSQEALASGLLTLPFNDAVATGDGYWLVWPKASAQSPDIARLHAHLKKAIPQPVPPSLNMLR